MTQLIYASAAPHVLFWANNFQARVDVVKSAWNAFRDAAPAMGVGSGPRELQIIYNLVVGYHKASEDERPPHGWMYAPNWSGFIPDQSVDAGREYQRQIDDLPAWEDEPDLTDIGIPKNVILNFNNGTRVVISPVIVLADEGDYLFCTWPMREVKPVVDSIVSVNPQNGWHEMPRSVWYARIEAREAQELAQIRAAAHGA